MARHQPRGDLGGLVLWALIILGLIWLLAPKAKAGGPAESSFKRRSYTTYYSYRVGNLDVHPKYGITEVRRDTSKAARYEAWRRATSGTRATSRSYPKR